MSSAPPPASGTNPVSVFTAPVVVALATVYVVWGSTYFAIRLALASFPPFLQSGARFLIAGTLLFGWQLARGAPWPSARQWRDGAIVGLLLLMIGNGAVVFAEQSVSSSVAAIFIGAGPLATALCSGLFGVWPRRVQWIGILAGFGGVVVLARDGQLAASPVGVVALVLAIVAWSFGSVLAQRRLRLAPGSMGFATEMIAGGAAMAVVAAARGEFAVFASTWPPTSTATVAFVYLVIAALAAFSAYMYLLAHVSATLATSYAYVNPLIAVLLGVAFGGETLAAPEIAATAIIVGSVVLITREGRRAKGDTPKE
jgi:drug/metabolite transporter (DMT)-like permease